MRMAFFFLFATGLFASFHILFYLRVVRRLLVSDRGKRLITAALFGNLALSLVYFLTRYADILPYALQYVSSLSVGITFVLLLYLVTHELLNLLYLPLYKVDKSKREFLKKGADSTLFALSSGYVGAAVIEGAKEPVVNVIPLRRFDFTIVQISDLHIGGLIDREFVHSAIERINALKPDIVCITGDLVDASVDSIEESVAEFKALRAKHGVYFVLGNHEYFHEPQNTIDYLRSIGITVLLNESITIEELKVNIVGTTDYFGYRIDQFVPDIPKAFAGINPDYPVILLTHQPKMIEHLGSRRPALILSGHTHGGQIYPFGYLTAQVQPFVKDLHKLGEDSYIYVNSGIGFWGPPMRLGCSAEIAYFI